VKQGSTIFFAPRTGFSLTLFCGPALNKIIDECLEHANLLELISYHGADSVRDLGLLCRSKMLRPVGIMVVSGSGGSRPGVWGCSQIGGRQKVFTCVSTKGCLRQSLCVTHKRLLFVGQKWLLLLVEICDFSRNNDSLKVLCVINSENVWNGSQRVGLIFHKLHRSRISTKCI